MWKKHRPDFLSETKHGLSFLEKFQCHFGYNNLVTVDSIGCSGGLALFYNNNINKVSVLFKSNRLIDVETVYKGKRFISLLYTGTQFQKRETCFGNG